MYNWIETTFNVSGGVTQAIAVILALAVVLLLFSLFIFILKRLMGGQATQNRNRQPRIAVMDSATVDTRRRLVLIRRDNIEHLLLIGGPSDVVVEQNIIRNTPLTQQRPGQAPPHGMGAPVRGPMAPGPDIPARPDEIAAQHETAPTPVEQARPPAPVTPPATAAPAPPAAPQPLSATPVTAEATSRRPEAYKAAPAPVAPKPSVTPEPVKAPETGAGPKRETGGGLNRASDLLRSATQNGFNRTVSRAPAQDDAKDNAPAISSPVDRPPSTGAAPAIHGATKPVEAAAAPDAGGASSALKSLARPFSPRERPSYGGHSISPPASGPAARAKTALLKPVDTPAPTGKVEPVMTAAPFAASDVIPGEDLDTDPPVDVAGTAPDAPETAEASQPSSLTRTESVIVAAPSRDLGNEEDLFADQSDTAEPAEASEAARENQPDPATRPDLDPTASGSEDTGTAEETASVKTPEPAAAPAISLEMSDLLEEEPAPVEATAEDASTEKDRPPEPPLEDAAPDREDGTADQAKTAGSPPENRENPGKPVEPVRAAPRPTGSLGDKNPIEDEMARILDELGGQPN